MLRRILVTGASGMLGLNMALGLSATRQVTGTWSTHPVAIPGVAVARFDLGRDGEAEALLDAAEPEAVIHCAAMTDVDACERDPEAALRVNAQGAALLARACRRAGCGLAFISTDAVFPGTRGGYAETDATGPVNAYGRSKLEGERRTLDEHPGALVLRTNMFGIGPRPGRGLAGWMLENARRGRAFTGFADSRFAPLSANTLAEVAVLCLERRLGGVLHAASRRALSKYDFARALLAEWGLDPALVRRGGMAEAAFPAPRPADSSLDGGRLDALLGPPLPVDPAEDIRRLRQLCDQGWEDRLQRCASPQPGEPQ